MSALDDIRAASTDVTTRYAREDASIRDARVAVIDAASLLVDDNPTERQALQALLRASVALAEAQRLLSLRNRSATATGGVT